MKTHDDLRGEALEELTRLREVWERLRAKVEARILELENRLTGETDDKRRHELNFTIEHLRWVLALIDEEKGADRAGSGASTSVDASVLNPSQPPQIPSRPKKKEVKTDA